MVLGLRAVEFKRLPAKPKEAAADDIHTATGVTAARIEYDDTTGMPSVRISEEHAEVCVNKIWWRVRCFFDRVRPDFSFLGTSFSYTNVTAHTRTDGERGRKKDKKEKEKARGATMEEQELPRSRGGTRGTSGHHSSEGQSDKGLVDALMALGIGDVSVEACRQALWLHEGNLEAATEQLLEEQETRTQIRVQLRRPACANPTPHRNAFDALPTTMPRVAPPAKAVVEPPSYAAATSHIDDPNSIDAIRAALGAPAALR